MLNTGEKIINDWKIHINLPHPVWMCLHQNLGSDSPDEEEEEHHGGEEEASAAAAAAQEEDQVAEEAQEQHPQHVHLKEQEEAVQPSQQRRHMLHRGHAP